MKKEIYVTGAGIVSALGLGKDANLRALINQQSGVQPIQFLETAHRHLPAGEVKHSNDALCEQLGIPPTEAFIRSSLLAIPAVKEALEQARIGELAPTARVALLSGITVGGMDKAEQYYDDFLLNDSRNAYIELNDCGACTEQIADFFSSRFTLVSTIVTACSSSANALMQGAELLRSGRADVVVAGGCECLSRYHVNGFNTLKILDPDVCRPFDRDRAGINLGEGAGYVVLETVEHARARGARPIGRLSGAANACDAYHPTASSPDGLGPYLVMQQAVQDAGLTPDDIDYINAHGTGTPNNDLTEGLAAMRLFGDRVPPIASIKAYTGHTTSAAGSIEAIIALLAIEHQFLPVNLYFRNPIPEHNFRPLTDPQPTRPVRHILSNSFGFGGNDTALVLSAV